MVVAQLSVLFSAWVIFFCKNVARTALFVFLNKHSGVGNAHGKGP